MPEPRGHRLPLSLPRRLVGDLTYYAQRIPTVPVQRSINVAPLAQARRSSVVRHSWCSIFTKAYALVAARTPQLRRAYIPLPCPHLYEHPNNIASVAIARSYQGEDAVFFARVRNPDGLTLDQLDAFLRYHKHEPVDSIALFRFGLRVSRLPLLLRRALWWYGLQTSGYRRAAYLGTFGVSVYSSSGSESLHPLCPLTTVLNYGFIRASGEVDLRVVYDHRVQDGGTVARALAAVEDVLHDEILPELRASVPTRGLAAPPLPEAPIFLPEPEDLAVAASMK
jgi:hypothetical protein